MGVRNWRSKSQDQEQWKSILEEAKVHQELKCKKKKERKKKDKKKEKEKKRKLKKETGTKKILHQMIAFPEPNLL